MNKNGLRLGVALVSLVIPAGNALADYYEYVSAASCRLLEDDNADGYGSTAPVSTYYGPALCNLTGSTKYVSCPIPAVDNQLIDQIQILGNTGLTGTCYLNMMRTDYYGVTSDDQSTTSCGTGKRCATWTGTLMADPLNGGAEIRCPLENNGSVAYVMLSHYSP